MTPLEGSGIYIYMVYIVENNHGSIYASIIYHLADSYVIYSIPLIYTLWLFNIAMEAMAHLQMVYLLKMGGSFHGYVR